MDPDISNNRIPSGHRETRDLDLDDLNHCFNKQSNLCKFFERNEGFGRNVVVFFFLSVYRFKLVEIKYHRGFFRRCKFFA